MISDASQNTVWRWDNTEAFGDSGPNGDPSGTGNVVEFPLGLMGTYRDKETGVLYNYQRDRDPSSGRYLESDPLGLAGGINTYAYAENNPLLNADPMGLYCETLGTIDIPRWRVNLGSRSTATPWQLFMVVVSPTASRLLRGFPGGRVDCYAKRQVIETTTYGTRVTRISWGYCMDDDCQMQITFWNRSQDLLLDKYEETETRTENKVHTAPIRVPVQILGVGVCDRWFQGLGAQ
jgi:RHS repeat-associated protein